MTGCENEPDDPPAVKIGGCLLSVSLNRDISLTFVLIQIKFYGVAPGRLPEKIGFTGNFLDLTN